MDKPLISIIVPCYKQAEFLSDALQSVMSQSYSNWECIIVNDGSPDNTDEIAKHWINLDYRFKYIKQENKGLSAARNSGIDYAVGEWILPLDSDDMIGENYLQYAVDAISQDVNLDLIYCKARFFGLKDSNWELPTFDFKSFLLQNQIFCSAFFKKKDWLKVNGYDTNMVAGREDWEFWINLLKRSNKNVLQLDCVGFFYRIKKSSMIVDLFKDNNARKIEETEIYIYEKHKELYLEQYGSTISILNKNKFLQNENAVLLNDLNNLKSKFIYKVLMRISSIFKNRTNIKQ